MGRHTAEGTRVISETRCMSAATPPSHDGRGAAAP